jgi:hypothetical protein
MDTTASTVANVSRPGLERLGFIIESIDDQDRRVVAIRNGPYSRQELALELAGSNRLKATMRICLTESARGVVRWQSTSMSGFGIPDDGVGYGERWGVKTAVDQVLGVMKEFVVPLLDKLSGEND